MSSIYGLLSFNRLEVTNKLSQRIDAVTGWWKPDSSFHYQNNDILLGQQNLHCHEFATKESASIFEHPSGYKIVSDARIDNRDELIALLKCEPDISNSALILALYLKYKETCFEKLVGAFALAIWDNKNKRLICARDQIGVKPLHYYFKNDLFVFGTQKKSISTIEQVDKSPDWSHILNSISSIATEAYSTAFLQIKHIPPAHYIVIENTALTVHKYWELDIKSKLVYKNEDEYIDQFIHLFKQSIDCRMDKQQVTATHCSGGLDSSGITSVCHSIAKQNNYQHKILSYNIIDNFKGDRKKMEENLMAFELLDYLHLDDSFINVNKPIKRSLLTRAEHEAHCCDGLSKSNNVNTEYEIQAKASELGAKVLLSGFPGDELVTSFCRPFYLEHLEKGKLISYFFDKKKSRHKMSERLRAFFPALIAKINPYANELMSKRYNKWRYNTKKFAGKSIFLDMDYFNSSEHLKSVLEPSSFSFAHDNFPSSLRQYQRNHVTRPHTPLRMKGEQLAGKHWHVDYRYPMADIRLLQYMISIPMEQKISKDMSRRVFRLGMKNYLPESLRLRDIKVAGSLKPMASIITNPNRQETVEFIQAIKSSDSAPFLNYETIESWLDNKKKSPYSLYPWLILAHLGKQGKLDYRI